MEMLCDRDYVLAGFELRFTKEQFREKYGDGPRREDLVIPKPRRSGGWGEDYQDVCGPHEDGDCAQGYPYLKVFKMELALWDGREHTLTTAGKFSIHFRVFRDHATNCAVTEAANPSVSEERPKGNCGNVRQSILVMSLKFVFDEENLGMNDWVYECTQGGAEMMKGQRTATVTGAVFVLLGESGWVVLCSFNCSTLGASFLLHHHLKRSILEV